MKTVEERFWSKVDFRGPDDCWLWLAGRSMGYGQFFIGDGMVRAHRVSYEWLREPIPPGLVIDHLCRQPLCVNPAHMEVVTIGENVRRGENHWAQLTHCVNGHEFTPDNTYVHVRRGAPTRHCRVCMRERGRRYRARLRQREQLTTPS